jgi:flavin reductase (DIM6/NTAB) family NADH-FMN oxidoreductase RutF
MYSRELKLSEAYRLIDTGPTVLALTVSKEGEYNIAPIAWASPARISPTRVVLGIGKRHKTYSNIVESKCFAVGIPHISQIEMINQTGTVSGNTVNKINEFNIKTINAKEIDAKIPAGMIGYIECKLSEIFDTGNLALVVGDAVFAAVNSDAYNGNRLLSELAAGKTVHHLGNKRYITFSDKVFE